MNFLLAPIPFVMNKDLNAFWTFEALIKRTLRIRQAFFFTLQTQIAYFESILESLLQTGRYRHQEPSEPNAIAASQCVN